MSSQHQLTPHRMVRAMVTPRTRAKPSAKASTSAKTQLAVAPRNQRPKQTAARVSVLRAAPRLSNKQRINLKLHSLMLDVNALKQELRDLAVRRSLVQTRALYSQHDLDGSVLKKAAHYFSVFRKGYRATEYTQPQYVETLAAPEFSIGVTGLGTDTLLEHWLQYTDIFAVRYFTTPKMSLVVNDGNQTCVLRASNHFRGVFTWRALHAIFPAVLRDPDLTQRLLGKEIFAPVLFHLHFNRDGRVTRHDSDVDFFGVLATLLQDSILAAEIMEAAKVKDESTPDAVEDGELDARVTLLEPAQESRELDPVEPISSVADAIGDDMDGDQPWRLAYTKDDVQRGVSPTSPSRALEAMPEQESPGIAERDECVEEVASRHAVSFLLS